MLLLEADGLPYSPGFLRILRSYSLSLGLKALMGKDGLPTEEARHDLANVSLICPLTYLLNMLTITSILSLLFGYEWIYVCDLCLYVCVHACMCVICVYTCMYVYDLCAYMCVCIFACMCVYECTCVYACMCVSRSEVNVKCPFQLLYILRELSMDLQLTGSCLLESRPQESFCLLFPAPTWQAHAAKLGFWCGFWVSNLVLMFCGQHFADRATFPCLLCLSNNTRFYKVSVITDGRGTEELTAFIQWQDPCLQRKLINVSDFRPKRASILYAQRKPWTTR